MLKSTLMATALAALMLSPAFAQTPSTADRPMDRPSQSTPAPSTLPRAASNDFINIESANDVRTSKLIGSTVYGPDNVKIGEVSDVLLDSNGGTRAVVVGVGGFLGVGTKDVAIAFKSLNVTRNTKGDKIDKITVAYSKDQLKDAPAFKWYEATNTAPERRSDLNR